MSRMANTTKCEMNLPLHWMLQNPLLFQTFAIFFFVQSATRPTLVKLRSPSRLSYFLLQHDGQLRGILPVTHSHRNSYEVETPNCLGSIC
jgi:hypothetical protein